MITENIALLIIDMQNLFQESTFNGKVKKNCSKLITTFHSENLHFAVISTSTFQKTLMAH
ncbi:MAG TPA: hypothetical protein QF753_00655 [Victivallales bacterium]|nr:hypothetical protein [Victivallales bacterium]